MESTSEPGACPPLPDMESASEPGAHPQSPSTRRRKNWVSFSCAVQICWLIVALGVIVGLWRTVSKEILFALSGATVVVCMFVRAFLNSYDGCTSKSALRMSIEERFPAFAASAREGSEDLCAICLEAKIDNQLLRKMVCEHDFHKQCFDHWVLHSPSHNKKNEEVRCPLCRNRELW
mmetsp:Transcript_134391/g.429365  ORF Transcript_134391/g.429365 Transcript_134391/m.429365 type:complete len:177 (+) Transcript_134391:58-588(+)